MSKINTLIPFLLANALVVALLAISTMVFLLIRNRRRKRRAVEQLISQVKQQSKIRMEKTGSFLNDIYQFEGDDLKKALDTIDKQEKIFFRKIIEMFLHDDTNLFTAMDATMAEIVETYKNLNPKQAEGHNKESLEEVSQEVEILRNENERLKEEIKITKETMSNMIAEFGNMFGGGKDHELAKHEIVSKVKKDD